MDNSENTGSENTTERTTFIEKIMSLIAKKRILTDEYLTQNEKLKKELCSRKNIWITIVVYGIFGLILIPLKTTQAILWTVFIIVSVLIVASSIMPEEEPANVSIGNLGALLANILEIAQFYVIKMIVRPKTEEPEIKE